MLLGKFAIPLTKILRCKPLVDIAAKAEQGTGGVFRGEGCLPALQIALNVSCQIFADTHQAAELRFAKFPQPVDKLSGFLEVSRDGEIPHGICDFHAECFGWRKEYDHLLEFRLV